MVEAAAASPGCKWLLRVDDGYGIKLSIESFTVRNFQRKQDFQFFELYWQFLNHKAERPEVLASRFARYIHTYLQTQNMFVIP